MQDQPESFDATKSADAPKLREGLLSRVAAGRLAGVHAATISRWAARYPELKQRVAGVDRIRADKLHALLRGELDRADSGRAA